MSGEPWDTLGLTRSDDPAEIRRAYARKLKAIDTDADPQAFVALRAALDQALASARAAAAAATPESGPSDAEPSSDFQRQEAADRALAASAAADGDAAFRQLHALLFGAEEPDPDGLAKALGEILDDPRMQHVDHAARVEHWLAGSLIDSLPRSDPILGMAVTHFGWESDNGRWDQVAVLAHLAGRYKALLFLNHVAVPGHLLHGAYAELTRDGRQLQFTRFLISGHVRKFLEIVRSRCPMAEDWLNPYLVARWDARLRRHGKAGVGRAIWITALIMFLIIALFGNVRVGS